MCKEPQLVVTCCDETGNPTLLVPTRVEKLPSYSISVLQCIVVEYICISFRVFGTQRKIHFLIVVFEDLDYFLTTHPSLTSAKNQYFCYLKGLKRSH
jgi:hypothetical protein